MKRPGTRLRRIAARLCCTRTMERLVDPTLADLQTEYANAVTRGRTWECRRILILGHVALIRVMATHGAMQAIGILHHSTNEDRRAMIRTVGASAVIMIVGTLVLVMLPFLKVVSRSRPDAAELALYLVPQALPIAIPVGLTFGILWGLGRIAASRRAQIVILVLAMMASVVSFSLLGWVVPAANQAFRVSVSGRPVPKTTSELTLGELRQRLEAENRAQRPVAATPHPRGLGLNYHYHLRWALAGAPLVLAIFAVALAGRGQWGRVMPVLAGCLAIIGYYVVMYSARGLASDGTLAAFGAAWTPNLLLLILTVAIMTLSSTRANGTAGSLQQ